MSTCLPYRHAGRTLLQVSSQVLKDLVSPVFMVSQSLLHTPGALYTHNRAMSPKRVSPYRECAHAMLAARCQPQFLHGSCMEHSIHPTSSRIQHEQAGHWLVEGSWRLRVKGALALSWLLGGSSMTQRLNRSYLRAAQQSNHTLHST